MFTSATILFLFTVFSYEWFGRGGHAEQEILISNRFAKLILDNKWKDVQLKPIKLI